MTNLDNIKQMNSEELANFMLNEEWCECCLYDGETCEQRECSCRNGVKAWLEQEATPTLTDDEKVILRNIDKKYKWITRDEWGHIFINAILKDRRAKNLDMFSETFESIKQGEKYEISKLLGE